MVKMSKTLTIAGILAAIAILVVLAVTNIYPNGQSNSAAGPTENNEVNGSELIINLNIENFKTTITKGVTLVDFWAPWCGPCRVQGPILEEVAKSIKDQAQIAKVNVDEFTTLANRFNVQYIPTLILFKDGIETMRFTGVQNKNTLIEAIKKLKQPG